MLADDNQDTGLLFIHDNNRRLMDAHRADCSADGGSSAQALWRYRKGRARLTEELVALGNDVTLFASGDSRTSAKLDATWPKALRLDGSVCDPNALQIVMLERVRQKCDDEEFDFLHFHLDYYPFSLFPGSRPPFLTTLHGRLDLPEHQPVFTTFSAIPVISISNPLRRPVPQAKANWVHTTHHGAGKVTDSAASDPFLSGCAGPDRAGKGGRSRDQNRHTMRHPAQDRGKSRSGRSGLLRRNHSPADGPPAPRLHRRNR
jgi:Glycosyltransferase Family 4